MKKKTLKKLQALRAPTQNQLRDLESLMRKQTSTKETIDFKKVSKYFYDEKISIFSPLALYSIISLDSKKNSRRAKSNNDNQYLSENENNYNEDNEDNEDNEETKENNGEQQYMATGKTEVESFKRGLKKLLHNLKITVLEFYIYIGYLKLRYCIEQEELIDEEEISNHLNINSNNINTKSNKNTKNNKNNQPIENTKKSNTISHDKEFDKQSNKQSHKSNNKGWHRKPLIDHINQFYKIILSKESYGSRSYFQKEEARNELIEEVETAENKNMAQKLTKNALEKLVREN